MKFYTIIHKYYFGIDLHARSLYICILDKDGEVVVHTKISASPKALLRLLTPYRSDVVNIWTPSI